MENKLNRKFAALLAALMLILTLVLSVCIVSASGQYAEAADLMRAGGGEAVDIVKTAAPAGVRAKSAYLTDASGGTVMFSQNENARLPIASMVKIMTTLIIYEEMGNGRFNLDSDISVSDTAAGMGGSQVFLSANTTHKLRNLLKSIVICSANDASVAMAEAIAGSEEGFVALMNKRAKELGMSNTHFATCTGLPAPEQYSSAKDVAIMTAALIKHKGYFEFSHIWLENYVHPDGRETVMTNTNKLVRFYKGCDGGKTGFTNEAMFCVSATAERGGMRLISVIIGAENSKVRFAEASKLLNDGFANYENKVLLERSQVAAEIAVKKGKEKTAGLVPERTIAAIVKRGDNPDVTVKYEVPDFVAAPMKAGEIAGKAIVLKNGVVVDEVALVLIKDVPKSTLFDEIKYIIGKW
ncbi:MAG: D-alanyl-D-alanine carboxypeptidase family protein [Christensenellales bacterium]|jgi:D-alanyl-D-alanine carboxypeptidase (penicillin-binding protein 5/6)